MAEPTNNKRGTLDGLSFRKNKRARTDGSASPPVDAGDSHEPPSNTTTNANHPRNGSGNGVAELPKQSRDATMTSRYFQPTPIPTPTTYAASPPVQTPSSPPTTASGPGAPLTPTSQGRILVPESSPMEVNSTYRPYQPYSFANNASGFGTQNGASARSAFTHTNAWGPPRPDAEPSNGFSTSQSQFNGRSAPIPIPIPSNTSNGMANGDQRTSRLTRGGGGGAVVLPESPDQMDLLASPGSPAVVRPGQKRRRPHMVTSDEEDGGGSASASNISAATSAAPMGRSSSGSSSSMSSGPPNPRIIRRPNAPSSSSPAAPASSSSSIEVTSGPAPAKPNSSTTPSSAPSSSAAPAPLEEPTDPAYTLWAFQHPQASRDRRIDAWNRSGGDMKFADQLLTMPRATQRPYRPVASGSQPRPLPGQSQHQNGLGRVAEREEEAKARRQAEKDRGAKSAIYANVKKPVSGAASSSSPLGAPLSLAGGGRAHSPANSTASSSRAGTSRARSPVASSSTGGAKRLRRVSSPSGSSSRPTSKVGAVVDLTEPESPAVHAPARRRVRKLAMSSDEEDEGENEDEDEEDSEEEAPKRSRPSATQTKVLAFFNEKSPEALQELIGCTPVQAEAIIKLRPFTSVEDFNERLSQGKKKPGPAGIRNNIFAESEAIFEGYNSVDDVLQDCEETAAGLKRAIATWGLSSTSTSSTGSSNGQSNKGKGKEVLVESADGMLNLHSVSASATKKAKDFLAVQPAALAEGVKLKEYQLLGVNWLNLLYRKGLSCILADEMGLGKTVQVISFFAHLKSKGKKGPHLVVVPSSTLENWIREFRRFAPSIEVVAYYDTKEKRAERREELESSQLCQSKNGEGWEVLITTYNLAQGDDMDRKFFKKIKWDACVFDEGHILKNFQSQRYQALMKFRGNWRLLLTGTPLQNNLQELVSLMNFILPNQFAGSVDALRAVFKTKGDSKVTLLAQERVSRAKKMMTPFVLRRRKDQVLKDLPKKTVRIEWCEMTPLQLRIYNDTMQRSRKTVLELAPTPADSTATSGVSTPNGSAPAKKAKPKGKPRETKKYLENSTNVLMDLRKAASHPMLFRTLFTDAALAAMTKNLLKEPGFKKRGAVFDYVKEDMEVMTDSELQRFCDEYHCILKFKQEESCYVDAGKVQKMLELLDGYMKEGRKVLIFSQFTQILDILQVVLTQRDIGFLVLTGSTAVDTRQSLVDEFSEDEKIPVFLLSTKAGGLGITLTAASVVIMFDQDFNPHNDRQAQDRAYRIGQKRDVDVVKLISKGTIEEDMLRLGETKLALDEAVAGGAGDAANPEQSEEKEKEMKMSLLTSLRNRFVQEGDDQKTS